jgi:hypothetical protein
MIYKDRLYIPDVEELKILILDVLEYLEGGVGGGVNQY